jgi:SAM-dependent methyltransferase
MDIKLHKQYQKVQESHWWFMVRDNLLKDIAKKYFEQNGLVLDFGCNYGHTTRLLQDWKFKASGTDISEEAIKYGRSIGISNIFLDSEKSFLPNSFDAVISLDVLEHIEDDKNAFAHIVSVVKPGGIIVIMVPAFMFLWGINDEISQHFRRYTLDGLIKLTKQVGNFEIVKKSYFNTLLFFPIALVRLFSNLFNLKSRDSDLEINNKFINKLFFYIFDFERKILKYFNLPIGVSILLILKKR